MEVRPKFAGRVVIVTAAGGAGIGQGVARAFAEQGASVVVTDVNEKRCLATAEEIAKLTNAKVIPSPGDVSSLEHVQQTVKLAMDSFGKIDIMVNNAGLSLGHQPVTEMPLEDWARVLDVTLTGTFYFCRTVAPHMIAQKYGRIINLGSSAAWSKAEGDGAAYACSKAGVLALTRVMAAEVGKSGVTVNAVVPAAIWNEFYEKRGWRARWEKEVLPNLIVGRLGSPQDVANAILFLAAEESSFITGEIITVAGGRTYHAA